MSKTSLSDSYSNLCRDYSSFIKWAISKISKNTEKWTDYTVSEPDTLLLSSIATMHDYAQYIIDQMYLNTDIDVCTLRFLHQVSAAMGQYLSGTNPIQIPIYITNNSSKNISIDAYEVFSYNNELFTNPNPVIIPANSSAESIIVRNTVNEMIYKINKNSNGEFLLRGNVETNSVSVYGIKETGEQIEIDNCSYIFDLLYDSILVENQLLQVDNTQSSQKMYLQNPVKPGTVKIKFKNFEYTDNPETGEILGKNEKSIGLINYTTGELSLTEYDSNTFVSYCNWEFRYLISSIDNEVLRIKISPSSLNNFTALLVKYTLIDDYPIKENLPLILLDNDKNKNLKISTISNVSIDSEIPIDSEKLIYLNSLTNIKTLCNKPYNLNLGELSKRIDNYRLHYEPNSSDVIPLFEYTTYDNKVLTGDYSENYFKNIFRISSKFTIEFNSIPVYDLVITYNNDTEIVITNNILNEMITNMRIELNLQDYDSQYRVFVGFKNLGNFVQYDPTQSNGIKNLNTEMSILLQKFENNILIVHKTPRIKFLMPYILNLQSNIILNQDVNQLDLMTRITELLYNTLIDGKIVTDTRGSYRRLELLIQTNIKEIVSINFTSIPSDEEQAYRVTADQHLVIDSPENYLASGNIIFMTRGDES